MRIVTLIENLVYKQGLTAEHGLSFYIETENRKILFDAGQSALFIQNAKTLGIDIREIDMVVISHGHYDHTGGLYAFLQENKKATVYLKKEVFQQKYHGNQRFIGTSHIPEVLEGRIVYVDTVTEIDKGIFIVPDIPVINPTDTSFNNFYIRTDKGFEKDEFADELFLTFRYKDKISILSSCSHRGITNIVHTATELFALPVHLIFGGFHLKNAGKEQYNTVVDYFRQINPEKIGVCHCTGVDIFSRLLNDCNSHVFYNFTGNIITDI